MDITAAFGAVVGGSNPSGGIDLYLFGSVAQLAEQRPLKPKVLGSIPSRPIRK